MPTITSRHSWSATYSDGTLVREGPSRYAELDRQRLASFAVFADRLDLVPAAAVEVPVGRRLVYRTRVWPRTGEMMMMLGTESEDRSLVDMTLVTDSGCVRIDAYGDDAVTGAPVLYDFEEVRCQP